MSRTRVLQLLPSLGMGGAERLAVHLARSLDPEQFEVTVVSMFGPTDSDLGEMLSLHSIPLEYLDKRPGFDGSMVPKLHGVFRRFSPDIAHSHLRVLQYALPAFVGSGVTGKVHTFHSIAQREAKRPGRQVQRLAFKSGVTPVAISDEVARTVQDIYKISPITIPNGIPVADYQEDSAAGTNLRQSLGLSANDFVFVCVANLSQAKNHALLLSALKEVVASSTQRITLLLVGDGPLRPVLTSAASELGSAVRFLGHRTDVPAVLAAANAFVLASDYEGNPLSVMEAMAAGRPVVATAVGGIPELITDGVDGLLVQPGSTRGLATGMLKLASNRELMSALGAAASETALARFSIEAMAKSYGDLYHRLARGHNNRQRTTT